MTPLSHAQTAIKEHPAKITAQEFLEMIAENPSVFEHWDTPLEITEFVKCNNSAITHLSPHLTFSGKNEVESAAHFWECPNLKIATGTYLGKVVFSNSGIKRIENLTVTKANKNGVAATFVNCPNLQVATGTYPGFVYFQNSGIERIENLTITNPHNDGYYADFLYCPNLKTLEGWDLSQKIIIEDAKLAAEKSRRALLKFHKESQPKSLPFL
jgi:hypothetical protein